MILTIKQQRKGLGVSQFRLAFMAKISRFRLALHEQGYLQLQEDELKKIHLALIEVANDSQR